MLYLILVIALTALVWAVVIAKRLSLKPITRVSFAIPGVAVLIVGSVFGHDFFNIDSGPIPLTFDRMLLAVLFGVFAFLLFSGRTSIRLPDATDGLIIALLGVLLFSALLTDWSYANNRPISRWLFFYLVPAMLYFLIRNTNLNDKDLKWVSIAFVGFGIYLALTAIFESRGWYGLVFPTYIRNEAIIEFLGRGRGPFMNPISNGIYITCCCGAAFLLFWHERSKARFLVLAAIPILFAGALATLTRSVWLGLGLGIGLIFWLPAKRKQRGMMVVAAGLGLVVLFGISGSVVKFKRDKHVTENEMTESAQLRPIFAVVAYKMFQERPFRGCGFGQYGRARLAHLQDPHSKYPLRKAKEYLQHNVFLSFLTETGLIGLSLLLLLLLKGVQVSVLLFRNKEATTWARGYSLLLMCILIAYCVNGMFHDVSIIPMGNMLLFFVLAIVANQEAAYAPRSVRAGIRPSPLPDPNRYSAQSPV